MKYSKIIIIVALLSLIGGTAFGYSEETIKQNTDAYSKFLKGDYESAKAAYLKAIESFTDYAPLYDGIGSIYLKQNDFSKAFYYYKKASTVDESNSIYKIHAQNALYLNFFDIARKAEPFFSNAIKLSGGNKTITNNINNLVNNDFNNINYVYDGYQNSSDKDLTLGNTYRYYKNYNGALNQYTASLKTSPLESKYKPCNNIGILYLDMGKNDDAIYYFKKAILYNPKSAYPYNNLGVAYARKGDLKTAEEQFKQAITLYGEYSSPFNNLGAIKVNSTYNNLKNSVKYIETIVKYEPENYSAIRLLGRFYSLVGQKVKAIDLYEQAMAESKYEGVLDKDYAEILFSAGKYKESSVIFEQINKTEKDPEISFKLAVSYEKLNKGYLALKEYKKAMATLPDNTDLLKAYGYFLASQNKKQEAKDILTKYVNLKQEKADKVFVEKFIGKL